MLQVDGYAGFETLTAAGDVVLAACWAHARRKFYEFYQATGSPIAAEALRRIAELYTIEKRIRGQPAEARHAARQAASGPLITAMKPWLEDQLRRLPPRGGLADAIHYALARWLALGRFSRTAASNSRTTPSSVPSGPWRSGARTTLIAERITYGQPMSRIDDLLPWNWTPKPVKL